MRAWITKQKELAEKADAKYVADWTAIATNAYTNATVETDVDFFAGTFSKSLGSTGGFCVSQHADLENIRYCIRSYIFTASASPSVVASTRQALKILRERPELRYQLWLNANTLYDALAGMGLSVGPDISPVVAVELEDRDQAIRCWNALTAHTPNRPNTPS